MSSAIVKQVIDGIRARGEYATHDHGPLKEALGKRADAAERALVQALNDDMSSGKIAVKGQAMLPSLKRPFSLSTMIANALALPFIFLFTNDQKASSAVVGASVLLGVTASVALAPVTLLAATLVTAYEHLQD